MAMSGRRIHLGKWLLPKLAMLYGTGFMVWRLLVASPLFARWWPLQVGEIFAVWTVVPVLFFVVAGLFWRSRWIWVGILIPMLWFSVEYGSLFLPSSLNVPSMVAQAGTQDTTLRVMTLNTWRGDDRDGNFAAAVQEWQPQLIAVQEVSARFRLDLQELEAEWPYQVHGLTGGRGRVALLSKLPILSNDVDSEWLGCHCMQVVVSWHGQAIRVIVVHIWAPSYDIDMHGPIPLVYDFNASHQRVTYDALLQQVESSAEPVIVLGDFNTTERQPGYRQLYEAGFKDAHAEVGWRLGHTYPAPFRVIRWLPVSLIRIDHVFYDAGWQAIRVWTSSLMESDHQALIADLEFVVRD
jgi:endonuclease/exonuclease/phosphatase (EEP) superfamily protein YafD